jgi:hypothetical protein
MAARNQPERNQRDDRTPTVGAPLLARLFHDPRLHLLLAYPWNLALRLREEGYDVPPAGGLVVVDTTITSELWPTDGSTPPWLPGFLHPETPEIVASVIAELVAARPEPTPCWNGGVPRPREQRARAAALRRVRARALAANSEDDATEAAAWWSAAWRAPVFVYERADVYPWFLQSLRRELREGPARSPALPSPTQDETAPPVGPLEAVQDEAPAAGSLKTPRQRLPRMPAKHRGPKRPRAGRR